MIEDRQLMKISLAISLVGIAALFAVTSLIKPQKIEIVRINDDTLGQNVQVEGTIEKFSTNDGNIFIELNDTTGTINVVMFERDARNQEDVYSLKENNRISVTGKITLYRTGLEIVAASIKVL